MKDKLKIDKHNLDEELVHQAQLLNEVWEEYATAIAERESAKDALVEVEAQLDAEVRLGEKKTEAQVKAAILLHPRRVQANKLYLEQKVEALILEGLKDSFHQRSNLIDKLCQLYLGGYYVRDSARPTETQYRAARALHKERG